MCLAFTACYKDKGSYQYHPINEISIQNVDTANGYETTFGQPLTITPKIVGTQDTSGAQKQYTYQWSLYFAAGDSVISAQKDLNVSLTEPPGTYTLQFTVTDVASGVTYEIKTTVIVVTAVFEGYFVMNNVNGKTRLDMLTFSRTTSTFQQHTDVLTEMGSALPQQGAPIQVYCMETVASGATSSTYRIYLVTATGTYKLDNETLGYIPLDDFRYEVTGDLPDDFAPTGIVCRFYAGSLPLTFFFDSSYNVYRRGYAATSFAYVPINTYAGQSKPFRAYPEVTTGFTTGAIFNMDKRSFTSYSLLTGGTTVTDAAPSLGLPTGKDMVFMEHMLNGYAYAVLKDTSAPNYYMLRITTSSMLNSYFAQITGTDIDKAEHFATSPDLGYLFYSVGGKVYEYDPFLKTSFLMIDKGTSKISYLGFQKFFKSNANYSAWAKLLTVGSYDPSGAEGSNGTLEQYTVPTVNGALQLKNSWTGFGKITSISFRERS